MRNTLLIFVLFVLLACGGAGYNVFIAPNVAAKKTVSIKIPEGADYQAVLRILQEKKVLRNETTFHIVSIIKKYPQHVQSGNYVFRRGMNNRQIVNILKFGWQTPVNLIIYNIRTKEEFSGLVGRSIEMDSAFFLTQLNNPVLCDSLGTDTDNILAHFIVANYELYWNSSFGKFMAKMKTAYDSFWNEDRRRKAAALHLSLDEVTTLASIVEKEVIFDKEMPTVAGVYLNRLRIGMPLQADPTLVFALRDFEARRVTGYHKDFVSPYNTYLNPGLPPGPICMPRQKSIDAVLNAEKHDYLYFCANPDMSGYSIFSKTYQEQMKVAAQYQRKLNKMNIY